MAKLKQPPLLFRALNTPNPKKLQTPSNVSDPECLLSKAGKLAVDELLRKCPLEVGIAIFKNLGQSVEVQEGLLQFVAQHLMDRWGIGRAAHNDGVIYVLALESRRHHLFAGKGSLQLLGHDARAAVLSKAVRHLVVGNLDMAVLKVVEHINWELQTGWRIRRVFKVLRMLLVLALALTAFIVLLRKRRRRAESRRSRELKVHRALNRAIHLQSCGSSLCAPCVVCLEPLNGAPLELACELQLHRRGHLAVHAGTSPGIALVARLPPQIQQRILGWVGPTVQDFCEGKRRRGSACALGVELFHCGHALHESCARKWLARQNTCPICRVRNPRIAALGAVPAACTAASLSFDNSIISLFTDAVHFVAERLDQPNVSFSVPRNDSKHVTKPQALNSPLSLSMSSWGGGSSAGGRGTTGSW